ncbi:MAG TPA: oligoendopeptidase F [Candidatus Hydrogenedentes bacterium]|nr:oligoendopeptidase F [Candidatus Hydrogenedentota bacterium]
MAAGDQWDLRKLFRSDAAWEKGFEELADMIPKFARFKGRLGQSPRMLRECILLETAFGRLADRLGVYAYLKASEQVSNSKYQGLLAHYAHVMTVAGEQTCFIEPEIQRIPKSRMQQFLASKELQPYRFNLEKLLRYRPHILSEREERVLAMQGEVAGTAGKVFGQLNDADLSFGIVKGDKGTQVELTHGSFRILLESRERRVRQQAFHQYYKAYEDHANTLAATLSSSVLQDVYYAKVRNYPSALEAALFGDKVPISVYDNLIATVRAHLPALFRYHELRRRALRLKDLHAYDLFAPIAKTPPVDIPYGHAVDTICEALQPLGADYGKTLRKGLTTGRWVDRYENKDKRSGAFSYGCYDSPPYILMNYKPQVLDSMFTLAHEAGHSMHTFYSCRNQPYHYSHYAIFVAEVASTFNECLLSRHLISKAKNKAERAALICREIDEIRGAIYRQTMFAEYEKVIHAIAEAGEPLTLERLRTEYRELLEVYFGPDFAIDDVLSLEALRIPHFYHAFYVYKYATGLSAGIALANAVLQDGAPARNRYLAFLGSGASKYPLDLLRDAGVDLIRPEPITCALEHFSNLVEELDALVQGVHTIRGFGLRIEENN